MTNELNTGYKPWEQLTNEEKESALVILNANLAIRIVSDAAQLPEPFGGIFERLALENETLSMPDLARLIVQNPSLDEEFEMLKLVVEKNAQEMAKTAVYYDGPETIIHLEDGTVIFGTDYR